MPLNIDIQQIFLHLLNFIILFAVLYFLLYKPVRNFMNKRIAFYQDQDDKAKENLEKSEAARAEYEEKLSAADDEIMQMREKAQAKMKDDRAKRLQQAQDEAEQIVSKARERAVAEHDRIIENAQKEITEIVSEAAEKIILSPDVSDSFDQFLDTVEREES
ncbi:MAG: ATP synthase F0 subunit B [Eubacterium sp.]|nr:ATP synthase F0 subunit B [Eubacterium sp.]